ncbi:MAG: NAD(P)/FAD-dependent oxidoreductase [Planctomycetales bacterium]
MIDLTADVAIIGSGFGGSLTALLLQRVGLSSILIDRGRHPRVVLGESSTPVADLIWQSLSEKYELPRLAPLAKWGSWQRTYPDIPCGLKRGFSYFHHRPGEPFVSRDDHANELLFAASNDDETSDTHWYRPEFDRFLVQEAQAAGVPFLDQTAISQCAGTGPWEMEGERLGEPVRLRAEFLIDASGEGQFVTRQLQIPTRPLGMRTDSRSLYGHFTGVGLWQDQLAAAGGVVGDHPFPCDSAALHHIIDGGWMFVLRFNNGVTSAGFLLDARQHPLDETIPAGVEWRGLLNRYPSIAEQFARAELTDLCGPLRRTPRLQRKAAQAVGSHWALLPQTAYALDALHSTGNAHNLTGIERLVRILEQRLPVDQRLEELQRHERILMREIDHIDQIVSGCYAAFRHFPLMTAFANFYFAGTTVSETNRRRGKHRPDHAFLLAHDEAFCATLRQARARLDELLSRPSLSAGEIQEYDQQIGQWLAPWNIAGLCDPARRNMYPFIELDVPDHARPC